MFYAALEWTLPHQPDLSCAGAVQNAHACICPRTSVVASKRLGRAPGAAVQAQASAYNRSLRLVLSLAS